ncbi:MAG: helix-turn-helix transcriptional regulator [Chitinophagaceae bacterium]|nr:helix-turn-helix transcriptional regulator [Chitinophagaceae bacterium]
MGEIILLSQMGSRIRELRKNKRMTQDALAEKCDFEKARLSRIETGQTNPTIRSLFKISKALEVNIAELFPEQSTP